MKAPPYDHVFFDADSTLTSLEGIDELARRAGVGPRVAMMTSQAMDGDSPLEEVYRRRLDLVRPSREALRWLGSRYRQTLVPGAIEVVAALRLLGKNLYIVSGGLRPAVIDLAEALGIPAERVHAVALSLDEDGNYLGLAGESPLTRAGGKAEVCRRVLGGREAAAVFVGDGVTDLEAGKVCGTMIGFGGVTRREVVRRGADLFVEGPSLTALLELLVTDEERELIEASRRRG